MEYLCQLARTLLGASTPDLDRWFGNKYEYTQAHQRLCASFANDSAPLVLFMTKDRLAQTPESDDESPSESFCYGLELTLDVRPTSVSTIAVIKGPGPLNADSPLALQLQVVTFASTNAYESLHSIVHFGVNSYFNAYSESKKDTAQTGDDLSGIPSTKKKITELETVLLHLQHNTEVPEVVLSFHPVIEAALSSLPKDGPLKLDPVLLIPADKLKDNAFLNALQSNVNSWIRAVQQVTRISRDPAAGTASQEIKFWLAMESALNNIQAQLDSPGVQLTLMVLRHVKRFHATMSFISDTGIAEARDTVDKYNQMMKDFPLDDLLSTSTLTGAQEAVDLVFSHINRKLRISPYPVWRCLVLVEAISRDLNKVLTGLLLPKRLMHVDFDTAVKLIQQSADVFATWEDSLKEFTTIAREITRKRSEKFIPIRIQPHHTKIKDRLEYILSFRTQHEELQRTLSRVLASNGSRVEVSGLDLLVETASAYGHLKDIDPLDTTEDGIFNWNEAEKLYNDKITRVEQAVIAKFRDLLATARSSGEMFRVFAKYNALFVRPAIRGAVQEYQARLIDNVKQDLDLLQARFRQSYANTEAGEMYKLHDIPALSGSIIWIMQIERQLDNYMDKIESVLGKGWEQYADGRKLYSESVAFRKALDTSTMMSAWLTKVSSRSLAVTGPLFRVHRLKNGQEVMFQLNVDFDPEVVTLFKEVRHLTWLELQVPHSVLSTARDARRLYPYAVSLMDSVQTYDHCMLHLQALSDYMPLIVGYHNSVQQLISKGLGMHWESFAHSYDPASGRELGPESRYVKFVGEFDGAVRLLKKKADTVVSTQRAVSSLLRQLESCAFTSSAFSTILESVQDHVHKLNFDSLSNLPLFVQALNDIIEGILGRRATELVRNWVQAFAGQPGLSLFHPLKLLDHELTLKNQVISLSPPVEQSLLALTNNLQLNLLQLTGLKKISSSMGVQEQFQDFSVLVGTISGDIIKAYDCVCLTLQKMRRYLEKWYQFQSLWDLDSKFVFNELGTDLRRWLQLFNEIRKERNTFDTDVSSKTFGIVCINFKPVQARISSKYDVWQHDVMHRFSEVLGDQMKQVCGAMETARKELEALRFDPSSTQAIVACLTSIHKCRESLPQWEADVGFFHTGQTALTRNRFHFPSSWMFTDQVQNEWAALNEILAARSKVIEDQVDVIRGRISIELRRVIDRVATLESEWHQEKPVSGSTNGREALQLLHRFEREANGLAEAHSLLSRACEVLEMDPVQVPGLMAVVEEITDFKSVWSAVDAIWTSVEELRETPWSSVIPRKIRAQIDDFIVTSKRMPSRIRQYSAFEHVQATLRDLQKTNSVVAELRNETIRERHWEKLFKTLRPDKRLVYSLLTLGDVWDLRLTANAKVVQDVLAVAKSEIALEAFIVQVKDIWSSFSLEFTNYRNLCRLIRNWDELFQLTTEHLNALGAMHFSPYFKTFEDDIRLWESKLTTCHNLFDVWIAVQRQWVYLEGVFQDNEEIKAILPLEAARFQSVNSEFFSMMRKVYKRPLVLDTANIPDIQTAVERLADLLNRVQKALGEFFERERQRFGRFYFIGDEALLEIIGNSSDSRRVEKHLLKMFAGISSLVYSEDEAFVIGFRSREGEQVMLVRSISLTRFPRAADWLAQLDQGMRQTLSEGLVSTVASLEQMTDVISGSFLAWLEQCPLQLSLLAVQVQWSQAVESALDQGSLPQVLDRTEKTLAVLSQLVLSPLSLISRKKCESLITELVHQRDTIRTLIDQKIYSSTDFAWLSQMTFHLDSGKLIVRQAMCEFDYGYEYFGLPDRLVRTPLVNKCFLTMTQALDQKLGGSPFGPAGTGKTETVKALGEALGKHVLVFCCDEQFDFQAIGRILYGICQIGAWGCFDEFNRLEEHILSSVSSLIEAIERALQQIRPGISTEITLASRVLTVNPTTGIFITMNPNYAGRNQLPDNLKKLFRSFPMTKPDKDKIADVVLSSQGFQQAQSLSQKIVPFFARLEQELSVQVHYDWGLRAIKNVLEVCGRLKRRAGSDSVSEIQLISSSIRDIIVPKLTGQDHVKMQAVELEFFPEAHLVVDHDPEFEEAIRRSADTNLVLAKQWLEKCHQLNRFQRLYSGIMLVGGPGSGKSTLYRTVLKALGELEKVEYDLHVLDAKVMSKDQLFGRLDNTTREWTDGIVTSILRKVSENTRGEQSRKHWIVFDGDIDPDWAENLNSVLDDNKLLTLPNGERIELNDSVRILFEAEDLRSTTPATVSRCGMIWFAEDVVTPRMKTTSKIGELRNLSYDDLDSVVFGDADTAAEISQQCARLLDSMLSEREVIQLMESSVDLQHCMPSSTDRSLSTLLSLMRSACLELFLYCDANHGLQPSSEKRLLYLTRKFLLALVWTLAGDVDLEARVALSHKVVSVAQFVNDVPQMTASQSILDFRVTLPDSEWELIESALPVIELDLRALSMANAVVPTVDTVRHQDLVYALMRDRRPVVLCGPPGSGKTMTLFNALKEAPNLDMMSLNFSKATTPELLIQSIEQQCEYRKTVNGVELSPRQIGRWLVLFCDEINLPEEDRYGTQRVISLMRQLVERNGFWSTRDGGCWVKLDRVQFVGACNPPTDPGRVPLSARFLRHVSVIYVDYPGAVSLKKIYSAFNNCLFKAVPGLNRAVDHVTDAMVDLYQQSKQHFPSSLRPHYVYSPRELTRWSRGIFECIKDLETLSSNGLARIWAHEALRLFHDRLVTVPERQWEMNLIQHVASKYFLDCDLSVALKQPILYSNWLTKEYLPVDETELHRFITARLKTFSEEVLDMDLQLHDDLIDHVLRMDRVLRQPQGHLILIGLSGCGKATLTRFVSWINGIKTCQLNVHRRYSLADFDRDLREVLKRSGCQGEKLCLLIDESHILESSFMERMNTLLANGVIPGLFEGEAHASLIASCREGAYLRSGLSLDSEEELYEWFTAEVIKNLHVVFTMNPPEKDLSSQSVLSPALFNRCVLNWMGDWSDRAKFQVVLQMTQSLSLDLSDFLSSAVLKSCSEDLPPPRTFRECIAHLVVWSHNEVLAQSQSKTVTPSDLIDFVHHFTAVFNEARQDLEEQQRHLNVGLIKLRETVIKVRDLRQSLSLKQDQLSLKSEQARVMLGQMIADQNEAERSKEASIEIQHALDQQERNIEQRRAVVQRDLATAEPAVLEAKESVGNIKKPHLTELRALANPPDSIKLALESVCVLLGHHVHTWREIQSIVRREDFIPSIVNFDGQVQMSASLRHRLETDYFSQPMLTYENVNRASKACGPLLLWAMAQVDYASILESVGPLREELMELETEAAESRAKAIAIAEMIAELEAKIQSCQDDYAQLITETQGIKGEMALVQEKVNRSVSLMESLSSERVRWAASVKSFESRYRELAGNSLLSAAVLTYSGYNDQNVRSRQLLSWREKMVSYGIPFDESARMIDLLSTGQRQLEWHSHSLPVDQLSIENAIMLDRFERYPFVIDPAGRALEFLRREHEGQSKRLVISSFLDQSFLKHLESSLRFGSSIVIEDAEHFDPVINHVLNREVKRTGGRKLVTLGNQDIDYSDGFQLYLLTRNPSIVLSPYMSSRTTLVNFTVTRASLETQILNEILRAERPEVYNKQQEQQSLQGGYRVRLRILEQDLLQVLSNSEGSILDNDTVVDKLEQLQVEGKQVEESMRVSEEVMAEMAAVTRQFKPLTSHCGEIFIMLEKLASLNDFYRFSLPFFMEIFTTVLDRSRTSDRNDTTDFVRALIRQLYIQTYQDVSPALLNQDKAVLLLLLSHLYTETSAQYLHDILSVSDRDSEDWEAGVSTVLARYAQEESREAIFSDSVSDRPLLTLASGKREETVARFNKVASMLLGPLTTPALDSIIMNRASATVPVAISVVSRNDPTLMIQHIIQNFGVGCEIVAMGSREGQQSADRALEAGARNGSWVLLQNVHLVPQWMELLEKRLETWSSAHPSFRLLMTLKPGQSVPITLLQKCRLVSIQSPPSIRASVTSTYSMFRKDFMTRQPNERPRLFLLFSWIHAVIQERERFGVIGWAHSYDFDDSDFQSGMLVLDRWLSSCAGKRSNVAPGDMPWAAINYLIKETIYGGKIDDQNDLAVLGNLLVDVLNAESYNADFRLVKDPLETQLPRALPDSSSYDDYRRWISELPEHQPPTWLALPANAATKILALDGEYAVEKVAGLLNV